MAPQTDKRARSSGSSTSGPARKMQRGLHYLASHSAGSSSSEACQSAGSDNVSNPTSRVSVSGSYLGSDDLDTFAASITHFSDDDGLSLPGMESDGDSMFEEESVHTEDAACPSTNVADPAHPQRLSSHRLTVMTANEYVTNKHNNVNGLEQHSAISMFLADTSDELMMRISCGGTTLPLKWHVR